MRRFASNTLRSNGWRHVRWPMQTNDVRIVRIHGDLVLRGIANKTLVVGKRDIRWSCTVSLVISNYFYTIILPNTNATGRKEKYISAVNAVKNWDAHEYVVPRSIPIALEEDMIRVKGLKWNRHLNQPYISFCNLWSKPEYRRNFWNAVGVIPACSSFVTFVAHAKIQRLL